MNEKTIRIIIFSLLSLFWIICAFCVPKDAEDNIPIGISLGVGLPSAVISIGLLIWLVCGC